VGLSCPPERLLGIRRFDHLASADSEVKPFLLALDPFRDLLDELSDGGETAVPADLGHSGLHKRQGR
jgi:hypothetical protein